VSTLWFDAGGGADKPMHMLKLLLCTSKVSKQLSIELLLL
jgi:hypothetical protein